MAAIAPALPFISAGLSVVSAFGQMQAGKAQARGLAQQAAMERVRARGEALKYTQQGVNALRNAVATNASLVARAGAGSIDPMSGSPGKLQTFSVANAVQDYYLSNENAIIAREGGALQAGLLMDQAAGAQRGGLFAAAGTLAGAGVSFAKTRVPSTAAAPTTTATRSYAPYQSLGYQQQSGAGLLV